MECGFGLSGFGYRVSGFCLALFFFFLALAAAVSAQQQQAAATPSSLTSPSSSRAVAAGPEARPEDDPCAPPECLTVREGESVTWPSVTLPLPARDTASGAAPIRLTPAELCSRSPKVCEQLPDAPPWTTHPKPGFWSFGDAGGPTPLRTNYEVWHDKAWGVTQAVWLGSIVYDVELTHAGLAHHRCVEGNGILRAHPSRAALYVSNLPEYLVGTGLNWIMLKFVTKPLIFEMPAWGSIEHIRGGSQWLTNCW